MRHIVLAFVCLAALLAYVQRNALSVPSRTIERELVIDSERMGLVMGCWFWGYAVLQIPAGMIVDRVGSRRGLAAYVLIWSLLTGLAGIATGYYQLLGLWALMGMAQAGLVPGAVKAVGTWLPASARAFGSGMIAASMGVGTALGPFIAGQLLGLVTWRQLLALCVVPGLVWTLMFLLIVPKRAEPQAPPAPWSDTAAKMLGSWPMWLLGAQHFFRAAAMALFFTWFPRFIQETQKVSESASGTLSLWPGVGVIAGGLLGGLTSDWILHVTGNRRLSRQGVAVAGMIGCMLLALLAYLVKEPYVRIALISLAAFSGTFGGVSGYATCIDYGGPRVGIVISAMNMCGNIGAGLFPIVVGWYMKRTDNWEAILLLFAGLFAVDALCWALLNPRQPLFTTTRE